MSKLYFVQSDIDGESYDLFAVARTRGEAVKLWREYYSGFRRGDEPDRVHRVPAKPWPTGPDKPHALPWHSRTDGVWEVKKGEREGKL